MKNVVIYSPDFSLCYSLLMYLQTQYKVVATTDIEVVSALVCNGSADLVIMDKEPDANLLLKCEQFKKCKSNVPLILTYVFNNRIKETEGKPPSKPQIVCRESRGGSAPVNFYTTAAFEWESVSRTR